jgi:hypothetical protein
MTEACTRVALEVKDSGQARRVFARLFFLNGAVEGRMWRYVGTITHSYVDILMMIYVYKKIKPEMFKHGE